MFRKISVLTLALLLITGFILWHFSWTPATMGLLLCVLVLALWLSEMVPIFVPTFLLIAGGLCLPLLGESSLRAGLIFRKMADPVLGLFFCGMCLGLVLRRQGLDHVLQSYILRMSRGSLSKALRLSMLVTAALAMWTTNATAMAIVLPASYSLLEVIAKHNQRAAQGFLIGLAMAANFGGMATPIGTAPNAIAIAALESSMPISFLHWMLLMLPLSLFLLFLSDALIHLNFPLKGIALSPQTLGEPQQHKQASKGAWFLLAIMIGLWISEPWHGLSNLTVGFAGAAIAFLCGYLQKEDLSRIDWDILFLIAGGLLLGYILEQGAWLQKGSDLLQDSIHSPHWQLFLLLSLAAIGSAISSNTATAVLILPIAMKISPDASSAIGIAAACSLGAPFTISTPANAMIAGKYALGNQQLVQIGGPVMIIGLGLIFLSLEWVIGLFFG